MTDFRELWLRGEAAQSDSINVQRIYIDIQEKGNIIDGIIFSQIMYWNGFAKNGKTRLRVKKGDHLWLVKRNQDWEEEVRVDRYTAQRSINRMVKSGLIIKKLYKFDGSPTLHLRINWPEFEKRIKYIWKVFPNGFEQIAKIQWSKLPKSLTENTPETTTDIKTNKSKNNDYLSAIVEKANGEKEPDKYIKDQFFGYRDDYLKIVQQTMGERRIGEVEKGIIVELSNAPNADPAIWEASCKAAILNWTGNGWPSWDRIIEIYEMGRGDYKVFSQKKWGEPEQGKVDGNPFDQFVNLNEELK